MIKLVTPKKSKKKIIPYYLMVFHYMIGDANGDTSEEIELSTENPFIERFYLLLNSLNPVKGTWGIILNEETIEKAFKEKQITSDDLAFLKRMMFYDNDEAYEVKDEELDHADAFVEGVREDTEYSFLVFEGITLYYVDENGKKSEAKVTKKKITAKKKK